MAGDNNTLKKSRFPYIYEALVWLFYVCIYKYSYFIDTPSKIPMKREYFPYPILILFAIVSTLYVIPFYRLAAPYLLKKKKYVWLTVTLVIYFLYASKISCWLSAVIFAKSATDPGLIFFLQNKEAYYRFTLSHVFGGDYNLLLTDLIAFMSIVFMRSAFENEQKKHLLEKDNLVLQLESLKAQLHPHFLFNTLNSIYSMSITGAKETPEFILRLSNMMRYILYDCQQNSVLLEKDIEFLDNYLEMEKKRYPNAEIDFKIIGETGSKKIAPLLFIPFAENCFKHGAHRLNDRGFVTGTLTIKEDVVVFIISNDVFTVPDQKTKYGGVGIENVKKRLALYYPDKHKLTIDNNNKTFTVTLTINL
ncbi:sensor histidine kinase [Chitinophagaceae bacterium LWZ2-11]